MSPDSLAASPPFEGAENDLDLAGADAVLFGAPHGTPYPDEDNGRHAETPGAIRAASRDDAAWAAHWDFDFDGSLLGERGFRVLDAGNLATSPLDGAGNRAAIRAFTERVVVADAVPLMLGGDDSVPIPFFEALEPLGPLTVVQIDAHIDWRDERYGEPFGYSSTMRRASELPHVERIIQIGIRGLGSARREEVEIAQAWGAEIITARALHRDGLAAVVDQLPTDGNCVITLDCDGLDPTFMPAVGAPTPGGLTYTQAIEIIAAVASKARLRAFDLVEFVAERDKDGQAAQVAARLVANVIGNLAKG